jgi:glycosyltransferase involved in cell wall biosynthesis
MNIALVADHLCLRPAATDSYPGDPVARVLSLAAALAGHGQQVTVYAHGDAAAARTARSVSVEPIPGGTPGKLSEAEVLTHVGDVAGHLSEHWGRSAPDVVHAHFWTSGMATLAAVRGLGVPVAATFHSLAAGTALAGTGARARIESAVARTADAVLADTSEERSSLGRLGLPQASVKVVPPGLDTARFAPAGPVAERGHRARLLTVWAPGEDAERTTTGHTGLATAVRALADVPGAELVIAGGPAQGALAGTTEYQAVTLLARRLGVQDRLIYTGELSQDEMPPLMRSADLLVHLVPNPAFSMVPAEAMACGTPVIASAASGAHRDAVIPGNTGFLVPPGDHSVLARRIRQLLGSRVLLEGYGIAAANRARSRYAWERIAEETLAVYEALAKPRAQAAA